MKATLTAAATVAMLVVAGCATAPPEPESMRDAQADFSAYRTFGWHAPATGEGRPASIVDGYIRTSIANEMARKGYVQAAEGTAPDLTIDYEAAAGETYKEKPFRIGVGVGSYGASGGGSVGVGSSSMKKVKEGSLVVHVIDPARETEIWRGSIERELGKGGVQQSQVQAAVTELFEEFPARGGPP